MEKQRGVRFLINKKFKNHVIKFSAASDRIASAQVKLTSRCKISITEVHALPSMSREEEQENFCDDLQTTMPHDKSQFKIIMGDFNAKIGEGN